MERGAKVGGDEEEVEWLHGVASDCYESVGTLVLGLFIAALGKW